MEHVNTWIKAAAAIVGSLYSWIYGEWSQIFGVLILVVIADYLSGIAASAVEGKISSRIGYVGIIKKLGIFLIIAMAHHLDGVFGDTNALRDAAIFFYVANELISVAENAGRIGLPLPPSITNVIAVLKEKGDKEK